MVISELWSPFSVHIPVCDFRRSHPPVCDLSVFVPHTELWHFTGRSSSIMNEKLSFFPSLSRHLTFPRSFSEISSYCDVLIKDNMIFWVRRKIYPPESTHITVWASPYFTPRDVCLLKRVLSAAPPCVPGSQRQQLVLVNTWETKGTPTNTTTFKTC